MEQLLSVATVCWRQAAYFPSNGKNWGCPSGHSHRAALGLSSRYPDAMVVVVSEETKRVSIAYIGNLYYGLSRAELDEKLSGFGAQFSNDIQQRWRWLRGGD